MNQRRARRQMPYRLLQMLLMASAASALSLSNFQVIASSNVPLGCILAYNQPLMGCTKGDFTAGNTCSQLCQTGIQMTERILQGVCVDMTADKNSVLGQALLGQLVDFLCGGGGDGNGDGQQSTTTRTSTVFQTATPIQQPPPPPTLTDSSPDPITETLQPGTEQQPQPSSLEPLPNPETTQDTTFTQSAQTFDNTRTQAPTNTGSVNNAAETPGGGSPFDGAVDNASSKQRPGRSQWAALGGIVALMLLR